MDFAKEFDSLFNGLRRAYGIYTTATVQKGEKIKGKGVTMTGDVTVELWQKHLAGKDRLGIVPIRDNATCIFGGIDIDDYSVSVEVMEQRAVTLELPLVVTRSKSGGAHLWCFCSAPIPAEAMRDTLARFAVQLGFPAAEVFPKQKNLASLADKGNWINMPYFDSERSMVYGIRKGKPLSIEQFIAHAKRSKTSQDVLDAIVFDEEPSLKGAPPCLQTLAKQGVPEGSRNNALFAFGVYTKLRWMDDWKDKLAELNNSILSPPLSHSEMADTMKALNRKEYFYPCKNPPLVQNCNQSICRTCEFGISGTTGDTGLPIESITKVNCDPPHYFAQINGHRIELPSSEYLISQAKFQNRAFQVCNQIPNTIKHHLWIAHINKVMETVDVVDAPEDAGDFGQFKFLTKLFCTGHAQARSRDELLMGKPWNDGEGWVWFRSNDLYAYLERQKFRVYKRNQVWSLLKERCKAKHDFVNIKGAGVNIWGLPEWDDVQDQPFDVPTPLTDDVF